MDWADYIRGKSVAIVGPAVPEYDQSEEVDSKDVVIRLRWTGELHHDWYGKRTDVSFYNKSSSRVFIETGAIDDVMKDLDWVIAKVPYGLTDVTNSRLAHLPEGVNGNQVPILLHDLSFFEPGPVYVYGADFYWNPEKAYLPSYEKTSAKSVLGQDIPPVVERIKRHDWNAQRRICQDAMKKLNVLGDERFLNVMKLTDDEYACGMRTMYPDLLDNI